MLRVLIVDDEPPARARIRQVLTDAAATAPHELVGEATNGLTALELMDRLQPDVVLLDIHMPGMNGIEVARHLAARPQPPAIVFVTAYDEHALEAFEVQALAYLLKIANDAGIDLENAYLKKMGENWQRIWGAQQP